jgi:ribonuclease Z
MRAARRRLALLAALLAALALAAWLARKPIGERLIERVIATGVGTDATARLGDGLHAYLCGTGSALPDADRAGACLGVLAGNDAFVFDAGSGSVRKLLRMGFPVDRLKAIFLTHLHSDHIDGLGELMLQAWIAGGRSEPIPVHGPPGTDRVVAGMMQAYAPDKQFRIAHHGPQVARPDGFGGRAVILPPPADTALAWQADGVRVTVIAVDHAPVAPAFGYRIDYRSRAVSVSGDTTQSRAFTAASRGVDVMFHDALNPTMVAQMAAGLATRGRTDAARIMHDIRGYHASPEDAARSAAAAGAKALVLYHLSPGPPSPFFDAAFLGDAPALFGGDITVARDGLIVMLPADGTTIRHHRAF